MAVHRLIPLALGHERMPKSASLYGDTSGEVLTLPVGAALLDTDAELSDGVRAILTPGHTPGHQSFAIDLPSDTVVLAADACDLVESLEREIGPASFIGDDPDPPASRCCG